MNSLPAEDFFSVPTKNLIWEVSQKTNILGGIAWKGVGQFVDLRGEA